MYQHRTSLILYTTAVCNLNCKYCFIDKNPALKTIDQYLDDSFLKTPDYYIEFAKKVFDKEKLVEMQFWGGEPSLGYHRAYHTVEECINYFPNFKKLMTSTNFVSDVFFDEFYGLLDIFKSHPDRKFEINLQLSIDGPEEFNDYGRGKGVTEQFTKNFIRFSEEVGEHVPSNIIIRAHFKPTLSSATIEKLQTKTDIINYFQFFETFQTIFNENNLNKNIYFSLPIPNTACPSPHTKQDGLNFANYCYLTREIEKENEFKHYFKYYKSITSFQPKHKIVKGTRCTSKCPGHCGNGRTSIGLLPNDMISCCHNGFVDLISEYKKNVLENNSTHMNTVTIEKGLFENQHNSLIFKYGSKEFETYEKQLECFYVQDDNTKVVNIVSLILLLAQNNQIDSKYTNKQEALDGAYFILGTTSYCVRDNLGTGGSIYLYPLGLLKLLLNGAREAILQEGENK